MRKELTAKDVEYLQILENNVISLNTPIRIDNEPETTELGDYIVDLSPTPEELAFEKERVDFLLKVIKRRLDAREEAVITDRYGLIDGEPKTLEEVGRKYNVSRERIRQVEEKAIRKLCYYFERKGIKRSDI